jgi:hypothetical protein
MKIKIYLHPALIRSPARESRDKTHRGHRTIPLPKRATGVTPLRTVKLTLPRFP